MKANKAISIKWQDCSIGAWSVALWSVQSDLGPHFLVKWSEPMSWRSVVEPGPYCWKELVFLVAARIIKIKACCEWQGPSPRLGAWTKHRNVAAGASFWRRCIRCGQPGILFFRLGTQIAMSCITIYRSVAATDLMKVIFTSQKIQMLLKSTKGEIEVYLCPDPNDVPLPSENQLSPEEDTPNVIDFSTPPGMLVSLQHFPTIRLIANELLGLFIFHT